MKSPQPINRTGQTVVIEMKLYERDALVSLLLDMRTYYMSRRGEMRLREYNGDEKQRELDMGIEGHKAQFCEKQLEILAQAKMKTNIIIPKKGLLK